MNNNKTCLSVSSPVESILKKYKEFSATFSLLQITESPTRITNTKSSLIDHLLTNARDKISKVGIIDIGLSDHQLIIRNLTDSLNPHLKKFQRQYFSYHQHSH